jgi:membrane-associated protein
LLLLVCGDLIGDVIYYWIGRTGITPLSFLHRRPCISAAITPAVQRNLMHNATKMLLVGKWTHTIGFLVLIGSGMLRLPLPRFILINLLATLPKSAVLLGLGYFAGDHYPFFERHVMLGATAACTAGVGSIMFILWRTNSVWVGR